MLNYFNTVTLTCVFIISLLITFMAFFWRGYKNTSKNALYFFISSVFVLMTVMFVCVLVFVLPKTDKVISSVKCTDYQTAYRNVSQYIPEVENDKVFQIEIIKDDKCKTPYLEVKKISTVLQVLEIFEVSRVDKYVLHMPPKQQQALKEEAFN